MPAGGVALISIAAGFVGAMSGMGGGVILIPVLTVFGVDIKYAIAVSLLSTLVISNSAATGYVRRHLPNLKASAFSELFGVLGALAGASMAVISLRRPLFVLCGGILLLSSLLLVRRRHEDYKPVLQQDPLSSRLGLAGCYYDIAEKRTLHYVGRRAPWSGLLMFGAGLISGWLGIGASALTTVIHNLVMGLPPKVSLTTSNLVIGVMVMAGVSVYLEAGLIDLRLVVPVILGVFVGALLGSRVLVGMTNRIVRLIVLGPLVVLGLEMIVRGIRGG